MEYLKFEQPLGAAGPVQPQELEAPKREDSLFRYQGSNH